MAVHTVTPNFLSSAGSPPICPPCDNQMKSDAMLEHMCASEFGKNSAPTLKTDVAAGFRFPLFC